jgi:hypothetical protein
VIKIHVRSIFTSSKHFSSSKKKLSKAVSSTTELIVSLIVNHEEHMLRALADTGANNSSSIILEAYTSVPFIESNDINR